MTIDKAIKHAEEVAEEQEKLYRLCPVTDYGCKGDKHCKSMNYKYDGCLKCAEKYRQLAEWLKDYKRLLKQEPKTGHWKKVSYKRGRIGWDNIIEDDYYFECSECKGWSEKDFNYCHWCGAKMIEEQESEDKE